ncbi:THO complex subunit 7 homolog [Clytia hemisphaerica]|uniref:THO complex subunit 7 homolog n=1 Tax=Clytia hemisphaerica TaxID=252671 RepID=UPI0034D76D80
MAVSEDDIIRQRLLVDGDGSGDDKKIMTALRTIIKWSTMSCDDEERNTHYQKIIMLLRQCEYTMTKHHLSYLMNIQERQNYETLYQHIGEQIAVCRKEIKESKEELQRAKVVRKNKQEYDSLAKIIEKHPERKTTELEINNLQKDISELNLKKESLMQKLEMRQKQFHVLLYSVQLLQQILEEDNDVIDLSTDDVIKTETKSSTKSKSVEVMDISK